MNIRKKTIHGDESVKQCTYKALRWLCTCTILVHYIMPACISLDNDFVNNIHLIKTLGSTKQHAHMRGMLPLITQHYHTFPAP